MSVDASSAPAAAPRSTANVLQRGPTMPWLRSPWALRLASLVVVLGIWQLLGPSFPFSATYPTAIVEAATHSMGEVLSAFGATLSSFAIGFTVCILIGIPVGLLMSRSRVAELALAPYVSALYCTPIVVFIPLFIIWLGVTFQLRVAAVIVLGTFPIILNTYLGAKEVDRNLIDAGMAFKANRLQVLRTIVVPGSLPYIFAGLRLGFSHAMVATVVAEMEASVAGVGAEIKHTSETLHLDQMWVVIILLGLFNVAGSQLLIWAERRTATPWTRTERGGRWLLRR